MDRSYKPVLQRIAVFGKVRILHPLPILETDKMTWEESFAWQVFEGKLLVLLDEALEEWEWRERMKAAGLPLNHWRLVKDWSRYGIRNVG